MSTDQASEAESNDRPEPGSDAGTSCEVPGRFTVQGDIVLDDGDDAGVLAWQRVVPPASYTQPEAAAYCAALLLDGGGWRLPTVTELVSLVVRPVGLGGSRDAPTCVPSIDQVAFPSAPAGDYWTGMTQPDLDDATYTDFADGRSHAGDPATPMSVRCVRNVQSNL
jgi:hypothetical protein